MFVTARKPSVPIAISVSTMYSRHRRRAVWRIVSPSCSISVGPASSDCSSWRPPIRSRGRIATASTMMPMPPSQWLSWRQKSIERSSSSILATSVAPVAVKPETASK